MTWEMVGVLAGLLTIQGSIFLAAAKSVLATKIELKELETSIEKKLYDCHSMPIFVPKSECDKVNNTRDRRKEDTQHLVCKKIKELKQEFRDSLKPINAR